MSEKLRTALETSRKESCIEIKVSNKAFLHQED